MARKKRTATEQDMLNEFSVAHSTLARYRKLGMPHTRGVRGKPARYDIAEAAAWMRENNLTGKMGRPQPEKSKTMEEANLRKTNAMADNWQIRNERELRELLPVAEVQKAWSRIAMRVRSQVLAVPDSAGPAMDGMNAAERIEEMKTRLEEALANLDSGAEPTSSEKAA